MNLQTSKIDDLLAFDFKQSQGHLIIGTDEAGRGPGAGPVYAAAVYFPKVDAPLKKQLELLNDSKKLSPNRRNQLDSVIRQNAIYSIHSISSDEIDKINILEASLLAMKRSCLDVLTQLDNPLNPKVFVDGKIKIKNFQIEQQTLVKGDSKSASIAAASILAKVERDRFMEQLSELHPEYLWHKNKGYLTKAHINAILQHGITKWHRKSFLKNYLK